MAPTKQRVGVYVVNFTLDTIILKLKKNLNTYLRWIFLSTLSGILAGLAAAVFLISLEWVTNTRNQNPLIIWFLPFAGFFIGWTYHQFGKDIERGHNLILDEIHDPKKIIPLHMAPFILIGTLITHLFGGSAGREGTAVQMGASLTDQLHHIFKITPNERKSLLAAGMGAGFGAAIGAPFAGMIFGMEVLNIGRIRLFALFPSFIASFVGYRVTTLLGAPHTHYPLSERLPEISSITLQTLFWVAFAGMIFGFAAKLFSMTTHGIEKITALLVKYPPLKPFFGGLILVGLFYWEGSYRYVGLGIPYIQSALEHATAIKDPIFKSIFTSLTVGTGFKGGEFIPLVFIGTTLGSALSLVIPLSFSLLGALGFAAVFGAASKTPIACTFMAMEIFGYKIGPLAFIACFISYYFSGHHGIYKSQLNLKNGGKDAPMA